MKKYKIGEKELRLITQDELSWEHVKQISALVLELKLELEKRGIDINDKARIGDVILFAMSSSLSDRMIACVLTENGEFDKNLVSYILQNTGKLKPQEGREILDHFFGLIPQLLEMLI